MAPRSNGGSLIKAKILENSFLSEKYYRLSFEVPAGYLTSRPGQFVMLRVDLRHDPLLGRPFSIYSLHEYGSYTACSVLYRVVGKMTDILSRKSPGDCIYVLGPLGRGFDLSGKFSKAVLVAGGTGIAPISFLYKALRDRRDIEVIVYYGAKTDQDLVGLTGIEEAGLPGHQLKICTEDCSRGEQGLVTALLERDIGSFKPGETCVFACGPLPMLRSLKQALVSNPVPAQVSIEERMACGMGTCLACAVPSTAKSGRGYVRACQEGPVFDINEVELEC